MERWKGRTALVTGASSGIGRATALALVRAGMQVATCARRVDRLPPGTLALKADMREEAQILSAFDRIRQEWGGVDVLVNNAGLGHHAPLTSGRTELWEEMLQVNVLGLCIATREAVSDMRRRGDDGHVIHISSMAAHRVPSGSGVYSATKYAVRSLTEGLRLELRAMSSGIRVTSISPGLTATGFGAVFHGSAEAAKARYGDLEMLASEDIAGAVLYALSQPPHVQVHDLLVRPIDQLS